jgi:hypothetical protein
VGLLKRETQTSVINVVCKGWNVPYGGRRLRVCSWRLPGSSLRSSTHLSSRAYLDWGLALSERGWQETAYLAPLCMRSRQHFSASCLHPGVPSSPLPASETRIRNEPQSQVWMIACHVFLMSPNGVHRVYPPKLFMAAGQSKWNASNVVWGGSAGEPAHYECCFTTTFDIISLSELTIAAHVSSAEDSRARTVKQRAFRRVRRRGREGLMTRRSIPGGITDDDRTDGRG